MKGKEIERKFLLKKLPNMEFPMIYNVLAWYIQTDPIEIRVRSANLVGYGGHENGFLLNLIDPYVMTIKDKGGLVRSEVNIKLERDKFSLLTKFCPSNDNPIEKLYYRAPLKDAATGANRLLEIHFVDRQWWYAEVEFPNVQAAEGFHPIDYPELMKVIDKEVTEDPYYKMANYWKRTRLGME